MTNPPWSKRAVALSNPASPAHCTHTISTNGMGAQRIWPEDSPNPMPGDCAETLIRLADSSRLERCGFVTADWRIQTVVNAHLHPHHNYYFDPDDTNRAVTE